MPTVRCLARWRNETLNAVDGRTSLVEEEPTLRIPPVHEVDIPIDVVEEEPPPPNALASTLRLPMPATPAALGPSTAALAYAPTRSAFAVQAMPPATPSRSRSRSPWRTALSAMTLVVAIGIAVGTAVDNSQVHGFCARALTSWK